MGRWLLHGVCHWGYVRRLGDFAGRAGAGIVRKLTARRISVAQRRPPRGARSARRGDKGSVVPRKPRGSPGGRDQKRRLSGCQTVYTPAANTLPLRTGAHPKRCAGTARSLKLLAVRSLRSVGREIAASVVRPTGRSRHPGMPQQRSDADGFAASEPRTPVDGRNPTGVERCPRTAWSFDRVRSGRVLQPRCTTSGSR